MIDRRFDQLGKVLVCVHAVTIQHRGRATRSIDHDTHGHRLGRKVGFTKNTAMRHRRVGGRAVTVTAMLHRQRYRVIEKGKD